METQNNNTAAQDNTKDIVITRTFDLPLDRIWQAWTEPESFKKWWGPKDFTCPECTIDLRVGGKTLACMRSKDGKDFWSTGTFLEIVPKKRLVYEDNFSDEKGNTVSPSYYGMPGEWNDVLVTVEFEDLNGKTKMDLRHKGIPQEMYNDCIQGWQECFDKMEKIGS